DGAKPGVPTVLGPAVPEVLVVERGQAHLHRRDLGHPASRLDLSDGDVTESDAANQSVVLQRRERADAGLEWRLRIDGVELIEVYCVDAECPTTRLACCAECLCLCVGDPLSAGPEQATLRGDFDFGSVTCPRPKRLGDQALVVAGLRVVVAVRIGGGGQGRAGV